MAYSLSTPSTVAVRLPEVLGLPVDEFAIRTANSVLLLIEELVLYAMARTIRRLPYPIYLTEILPKQRNPSDPQRFRLAAKGLDDAQPWLIKYSDSERFL